MVSCIIGSLLDVWQKQEIILEQSVGTEYTPIVK